LLSRKMSGWELQSGQRMPIKPPSAHRTVRTGATGLRDENSNLVAMLSISGPSTRLQYKGIDKIIEKLKEKASLITEAIVK